MIINTLLVGAIGIGLGYISSLLLTLGIGFIEFMKDNTHSTRREMKA